MRGFWVRIFGVFWLIEILIICAFAGFVMNRMSERALSRMAFSALESYRAGGCGRLGPTLQRFQKTYAVTSYLFDESGHSLCGREVPEVIQDTVRRANASAYWYAYWYGLANTGHKSAVEIATYRSNENPRDLFVAQSNHPTSWLYRFRNLTGIILAIAISGIVTAIFALFLVRPITRLRQTTRELASGDLTARADEGKGRPRGNEIAALVHDFNQMAERIESLVGAQRQLIRDVSHELRSPLARLSIALELMREEADGQFQQHLDRMEREAERLNRLIGQLLELSRIETMAAPPKNEPVRLEDIVQEVVANAAYEASGRNCGVRPLIRDQITVSGDSELLSSALENIVRNGIRYTSDETEVNVTLERARTSGAAVVTVRDFGPGVPEDKLRSLCLPFYRVDAARVQETGGAGVGLAIAERALRIHGGSLHLTNHPDGGLEATICLPGSTVLSASAKCSTLLPLSETGGVSLADLTAPGNRVVRLIRELIKRWQPGAGH